METAYDRIGIGYAARRKPDPRVAAMVSDALGGARTVVNVGAGAGSYEPKRRALVAVEPSIEMIRQRPPGSAPVVMARAEALPFPDRSFDAALAILTLHHWSSPAAGLAELRRVAARRVVILTMDLDCYDNFWLVSHYLPEITQLDQRRFPTVPEIARLLGDVEVRAVPIPADCRDGFQGAFWRRPEAYLESEVRRGMSSFAELSPAVVDAGLARLSDDLRSGRWERLFGHLRAQDSADLGYRLIVAGLGS